MATSFVAKFAKLAIVLHRYICTLYTRLMYLYT